MLPELGMIPKRRSSRLTSANVVAQPIGCP
jgi:hypothetical protein